MRWMHCVTVCVCRYAFRLLTFPSLQVDMNSVVLCLVDIYILDCLLLHIRLTTTSKYDSMCVIHTAAFVRNSTTSFAFNKPSFGLITTFKGGPSNTLVGKVTSKHNSCCLGVKKLTELTNLRDAGQPLHQKEVLGR